MAGIPDPLVRILDRAFRVLFDVTRWNLTIFLATVALLAALCLWKIPQWQTRKLTDLRPKERFDSVNEARKTLAQILGGIALLVGLYSAWQNFTLARESLSVSQQGQITDRFTKA